MNVKQYLKTAKQLQTSNKSDGCTMPFSSWTHWIHKYVNKSKLICTAHDFGSRGLIKGVNPGWHNNLMFFKANWQNSNYIWAVTSFVGTLPYALVRYNLGIKMGVAPFYGTVAFLLTISFIYLYTKP